MPSLGSLTGIFGKFGKKASPPPVAQPPEMQCTVLPNGMEVWSIYNPNAYTHEFEIGRKTGSLSDPSEFPHLSHLEEHLWGHNFPGMSIASWNEWCTIKSISTNAATGTTSVYIFGMSDNIQTALEYAGLCADAISSMVFKPADVEHEKRTIITENGGRKNLLSYLARNKSYEKIVGVRDNSLDFDKKKFSKITAQDIQRHAAKHMVGDNLYALSIGNIPHHTMVEIMQNKLGHLPKGNGHSRTQDHIITPETVCWKDDKNDNCAISLTYNIPTHVGNEHTLPSLMLLSDVLSNLLEINMRHVMRVPIYNTSATALTDLNAHNPKLSFGTAISPEYFSQCINGIQTSTQQIIHSTPEYSVAERIRIAKNKNTDVWINDDFKRRIRAGEKPKTIQEQYDALDSLSPAKFRQTLKDIVSTPPLIYLSGSLPPAHLRPTPEGFTSAFTNVNIKNIVEQPSMAPRR